MRKTGTLLLPLLLAACGGGEPESEPAPAPPADTLVRQAKDEHLEAIARLAPKAPAFGADLRVDLELRARPGAHLLPYEFGAIAGHFRVRRREMVSEEDRDGLHIARYRATLESRRSGPHIALLAPVRYRLDAEAGKPPHELRLPAIDIEVGEPGELGDPDLENLAGPRAPLPFPDRRRVAPLLWYLLGALALAILAGILLWRRAHRRRTPASASIDPRTLALEELAALRAQGLIERGLHAEFYYELTRIVRCFIERTTSLRAPEQTTEEFLRAMEEGATFSPLVRLRLRRFLESADLVKYAAQVPAADAVEESLAAAAELIDPPAAGEEAA